MCFFSTENKKYLETYLHNEILANLDSESEGEKENVESAEEVPSKRKRIQTNNLDYQDLVLLEAVTEKNVGRKLKKSVLVSQTVNENVSKLVTELIRSMKEICEAFYFKLINLVSQMFGPFQKNCG